MLPEPENTGATGRNLPPLPKGVAGGYTTPGGKTVTPSYGDPQWASGSAIDQLLQQIATDSGISSLFGLSGNSAFDDLHPSTVGQAVQQLLSGNAPVTPAQIVKALDGLHQMPQFNQLTGSYGPTQRQRIEKQILDAFAGLHQLGDPSGGRLPGTAKKRPDLTWIEHLGERSRQQAMTAVHQWIQSQERAHDPGRQNPIHGGPHPQWWQDNPDGGSDAGKGDSGQNQEPPPPTNYVTPGGRQGASPGGSAGGAPSSQSGTGYAFPNDPGQPAVATTITPETTATAVAAVVTGTVTFELGPVAGIAAGLGAYLIAKHLARPFRLRWFFPSDEGGGGPRSNPAAEGSSRFMPDPESGSGGGPRSHGEMPDPETGTGGGPRGIFLFPEPDSGSGTGPKSRVA